MIWSLAFVIDIILPAAL